MIAPELKLLAAMVLLGATSACGGYDGVPVPVREVAEMAAVDPQLHPGAVGLVTFELDLPEDLKGPVLVVGAPQSRAQNPTVANWAWGPCQGVEVTSHAVCVGLWAAEGPLPGLVVVDMAVEDRRSGRRWTVTGSFGEAL